jgi:phosphatidate phosphatase PAH1
MFLLLSACRRGVLFALLVFAIGLGGCAHLSAVVVPQAVAGTPGIVVLDVDGTLTPTVARIFSVRADAAAVVRTYAERGHRIVYLTARAPALQGTLRGFLSRNGFPPGDLVAPKDWAEHEAPAAFKSSVLADYRAHGWDIAAAYGDSSSDFEAYAREGIPRERVFALRRVGATHCQPGVWSACLAGWEQQRQKLRTRP